MEEAQKQSRFVDWRSTIGETFIGLWHFTFFFFVYVLDFPPRKIVTPAPMEFILLLYTICPTCVQQVSY